MHAFVYTGLPSKVLFGFGTRDRVADEVRLLDCRRALVLSTPQQEVQANDLAGGLGRLCVGTFTQAAMHTPVAITEQALAVARERQADCTVALGGGSTTGLGKAIALRTDLVGSKNRAIEKTRILSQCGVASASGGRITLSERGAS
jgi:maleylacetate reductase